MGVVEPGRAPGALGHRHLTILLMAVAHDHPTGL